MAMRILSTRLLSGTNSMRICPAASMSSSLPSSEPIKNPPKKRESFKSMWAQLFGGYIDPADPNEPPIPADKVNFPDVTEHATGEAKLFLLAFENGFLDPYCNLPIERQGRGSKDNPVKIESFFNERMVACICEATQNHAKYTTVYRGEPKRCQCGHWMELVDAPKFWEKIPKEDLITIPFFRELEEEGKLDKLLSGELDKELEREEMEAHKKGHHHH